MLWFLLKFLSTFSVLVHGEIVQQYHIHEISLKGSSQNNPFTDDVDATFTLIAGTRDTKPSANVVMTVPGFYDGNQTWKIRFSPSVLGNYSWTTNSSNPTLNKKKGTVTCTKNTDPSVHGKLVVDYNYHFKFEDGTRHMVMGYEADWLWALDLENDTSFLHLDDFVSKISKAGGFNHWLVQTYAKKASWSVHVAKPPKLSPTTKTPWVNGDQSKMDLSYWSHFDSMVRVLAKHGSVAHIMIMVFNKGVDWPKRLSADDSLFWRYTIARYQAYWNVVFDLGKEANRVEDSYWTDHQIPLIRKLNGHKRLVTIHTGHESYKKELDFVSDQTHGNYHKTIRDHRNDYKKPVINVEFMYEKGPIRTYNQENNPEEMRKVMWGIYMAGGYAAWYYDDTAWDVMTDDITVGYGYCKHLTDFWLSIDEWKFGPQDDLVSASETVYGRAITGQHYLAYLPNATTVSVKLQNLEKPLTARWYYPKTGKYTSDAGQFGNGTHSFSPPENTLSDMDILLELH